MPATLCQPQPSVNACRGSIIGRLRKYLETGRALSLDDAEVVERDDDESAPRRDRFGVGLPVQRGRPSKLHLGAPAADTFDLDGRRGLGHHDAGPPVDDEHLYDVVEALDEVAREVEHTIRGPVHSKLEHSFYIVNAAIRRAAEYMLLDAVASCLPVPPPACVAPSFAREARAARPPGASHDTMRNHAPALVACLLVLGTAHDAYAYLDPGSGSMLLQLLLGGVAAIGVAGRLAWKRMRAKAAAVLGQDAGDQDESSDSPTDTPDR